MILQVKIKSLLIKGYVYSNKFHNKNFFKFKKHFLHNNQLET